MSETQTISATQSCGTEIVCFADRAEPLYPRVNVRHDASYVTQLLANAADLPNIPQRRRSDKAAPLAAYVPVQPGKGRTRRII